MKISKIVFILAAVLPVFSFGQPVQSRVEGELLVKFRDGTSAESSRRVLQKNDSAVIDKFDGLGWQRIKLPAGKNVDIAAAEYLESSQVEAVQPNYYYRLLATPNDANFAGLWGMAKISAPQAWDLNTGSSSVVIANIDTGIKYDHADLAANIWTNAGEVNANGIDDDNNGFVDDYYGYDFYYNDPNPMDENGHGTHTAGTMGAVGNNLIGVAGVNWNVKIMAIKIYDSDGNGTTSAMLINAYNYIRLMKQRGVNIRVTNNSYGGCDEACGYDQATKDAIDALGRAGVLQVFAAGNNGQNADNVPMYPAAYDSPWIISVANSTSTDARNSGSNYGLISVDLAAPGTSIQSTLLNGGYGGLTGTSMAAPHVAGAAALLAAHNPNLSLDSIKATILNQVDQLPAWNGVVKTGGRLNVAKVLQNQTSCSYAFSGLSVPKIPTKGGYFSVTVTTEPNCDYAVSIAGNWIKPTDSNSFSGTRTITFRATVNPTITRTGSLNIGSSTVAVTQSRVQ